MKIIRLNSKDIKKLKEYEIHSDIDNSESTLYLYEDKLLKLFNSNSEEIINNKMFILNKLFYIKDSVDIKEVVWPINLVSFGKRNKAYTMELIESNTNLSRIFNSNDVSLEDKIYFLKKIGYILRDLENNNELERIDFHLGDIHEGNFIYDNENNMVKVIDIDSSYVSGAKASRSKYLTFNDKLWDFPNKYPLDDNNKHISSNNTTILSYFYMLLNLITEEYSPDFSIKVFCNVLNKLKNVGFNTELLDSIYNIYSLSDNYFDYDLLNSIDSKLILKYREK